MSAERRLRRRVANDALVDVDTVRYSVPHRLVQERVEVALGASEVRIFHGAALVATHRRSLEPHSVVRERAHFAGLWRPTDIPTTEQPEPTPPVPSPLGALGRSLDDYAAVIGGARCG